jgi:hypothetical protein
MYRACSTWQYEVVAHLIERRRGGHRLGYVTGEEYAAIDDAKRGGVGWRVLKSHEEHRRFKTALAEGRARAIYAHRDLRDVVFSLMHKRGLRFEELLRQGMIHQILVNDRFWRSQPGVLVQRYEDLIAYPVAGVAELARHLGITLGVREAETIAREYSFQANRERIRRLDARLRAAGIDLERPASAPYYDRETLLHWNHLRQGRVGSWRTEATRRQRVILARIGSQWLRSRGYEVESTPGPRGNLAAAVVDRAAEARGRLACMLRCLALRFPRTANLAKRLLMIRPDPCRARPERAPAAMIHNRLPGSRSIPASRAWRADAELVSMEFAGRESA